MNLNLKGFLKKNLAMTRLRNYEVVFSNQQFNAQNFKYTKLDCRFGSIKCSVADTGYGIDNSCLSKVFEQSSQLSEKQHVGTGLGLYISNVLSKSMNGDIKAFSSVGRGSTFIMTIPTEITLSDIDRSSLATEKPKIDSALIIEDDPLNQIIMKNFLVRLGIQHVVIAVNGVAGVRSYIDAFQKGAPFKLVTIDHNLPGMNGDEALAKIRDYENSKNMQKSTAFMIRGHCSGGKMESVLNAAHCDEFLQKPVTFEMTSHVFHKYFQS